MSNEKLWTKDFILASFIQAGINVGYWSIYSTLGIYVRGISSLEVYVGIAVGSITVASFFTRLVSGKLLESFPYKKILLLGLCISLIANLGYLFADTMQMLLIMRILNGFGYGLASAAAATIISSMLPPSRLAEGLGYSMVITTMCGAVGPTLALTISQSDFHRYGLVFQVFLCLAGITLFLGTMLETQKNSEKTQKSTEKRVPVNTIAVENKLTGSLATGFLLIIIFGIATTHTSITVCLNLFAMDYGFGDMSLFFLTVSAVSLLPRFFMRKLLEIFSERKLLVGTVGVLIMVYLGLYVAESRVWIYFLAIPFGAAIGLCYPILTTKTIRTMDATRQGTSNSLYLAAQDLSCFVGAVLWSGLSAAVGGYRNVYLLVAGMAGVVFLLVLWYPTILRKRHVEEDVWN